MRRLLVTCLSLLLIANVSYAQAKPLNIPVVYYKLPNGLKVVISEDHIAPVVTVAVYYNVGFRLEPKGRTGFAHLFEHMMFQGSANVKKFEHAKFVEANGGSLNGHTDFDYTNYYQTLPSNRVELALWLESDRMRSLDVSEENLKNQQAVVSEEVRVNVLNQPYGLFEWISLWENAFTNWHNSHNGYGELAEINAATIEDVRSFFKTYYAPNNAVLTVVGDVDVIDVKKMVEKHFATIPSQPMFDETHYVPAARDIFGMAARANEEHPPFAKWLIGLSMALFGDSPAGFITSAVSRTSTSAVRMTLRYASCSTESNGCFLPSSC